MRNSSSTVTRRAALRTGTALLAAPPLIEKAGAQSGAFDWRRFRGERIEATVQLSPRGQLLQQSNAEFEELTGIKVGLEVVPEQQHRQKIIVEYASGRPSFDVTEISLHVNKRQVGKARWNTDIKALIADRTLTSPDFDFADFGQGMVTYATQADGRHGQLPGRSPTTSSCTTTRSCSPRRTSQVPKTWDEMYEAAKRLADPSKQVYGHVGRGVKNANVVLWSSYLLGTRAARHDRRQPPAHHRHAATRSGPARPTRSSSATLSPPGSIGFNWNECQTTFMQGRAAMWVDGIGFAAPLEDTTRSRVAGKVGYARGAARARAPTTTARCSAPATASPRPRRKKGPAWFYIQWALGKPNQLEC